MGGWEGGCVEVTLGPGGLVMRRGLLVWDSRAKEEGQAEETSLSSALDLSFPICKWGDWASTQPRTCLMPSPPLSPQPRTTRTRSSSTARPSS